MIEYIVSTIGMIILMYSALSEDLATSIIGLLIMFASFFLLVPYLRSKKKEVS